MRYDAKRTNNIYNLDYYVRTRTKGRFNIPALKPADSDVKDFQSFNVISSRPEYDKGVHFFISDYQFERLWREPARYIKILKNFPCVLTPDFSLYTDMPIAIQVYNIYRSRLIGQIMQQEGICVIPTLQWSTPESYDFAFDGTPEESTVAVSTVGVMKKSESISLWCDGMAEALKRLRPKKILMYADKMPDFVWPHDTDIVRIKPNRDVRERT